MRRIMLLSAAVLLAAGCTVVGPPGPMGPAGPEGAQGPTGQRGYSSVGAPGQTGRTGPRGLQGSTGTTGDTGATGDLGAVGARGATGASGPAGAEGDVGRAGATGAAGARGATGATGSAGVPGEVAQVEVGVREHWTAYREVNFDPTSTNITASDTDRISEIAAYLSQNPSLSVGIDGTMDAHRFNQSDRDLSDQRAESVRDALMQAGVPARKIRIGAFAEPDRRQENQIQVLIKTRT
jgi:outer membrane protein OmpA-like peptidoglycan-associated protein